ncbi:alpha/beta fold hydrolase [Microbacterium sp. cf332]|uniref:alpha/beta fold hydrolase n=1 Tax=Microbacterium sp. cf332 TaxID=1761804 RepID=UPI000885FED9|nr:alpha/beta fold hydrolase [Microbacterium sp. cf332]SDQ16230.1 Pimeloyl-ACP methyl ester carboxylesterase [Microbacterium sp. cf332]
MTLTTPHGLPRAEPRPVRTSVGDLSFRVWSSGPDDADATVVLLHGVGMSHRSFRRLQPVLAASARVHSLDLPGFAGLPSPRRDLTVRQMADSVAVLLRQLSERPVVLVGHSMGAQWAVECALRHPSSVHAVALIGPVVDDHRRSLIAQALALARDGLREPPRTNARVIADYLRTGVPWFLAQVRHMLAYPIEERVARLGAASLIIWGSRDLVAEQARVDRLAARTSRRAPLVVPGAPHHAARTDPGAVACGILSFSAPVGDPAGRAPGRERES